ncbi:MAG: amidase family protein, partial [Alphaproteobacteria bacterium]
MLDIKKLDLKEIRNSLLKGDFTSEELVLSYIDRINNSNKLNTYNTLNIENAIRIAKESDRRISQKNARSLEGIPIGIKDLFCTKDVRTTA